MNKSIDFFTKSSIAKFAKRSKKFAALAETTNISVVFENEKKTSKSYSLKQSLVNKQFIRTWLGLYWESTGNNIGFEQKGWKNLCVPTLLNL